MKGEKNWEIGFDCERNGNLSIQANKAAGGHSPTTDDETDRRPDRGWMDLCSARPVEGRRVEGGSVGRGVGGAGVALGCVRRRLGEESSLGLELDFLEPFALA